MDRHVKEYYSHPLDESPSGNFHKVIPVHEAPYLNWDAVVNMVPNMCKGWFELAHLPIPDRIEFSRDFWLSKLPYHSKLDDALSRFFNELDDLAIFLIQRKFDDPFEANLVYSLKDDRGFFRGSLPATLDDIFALRNYFPDHMIPEDFCDFLQIHNGFAKTTDATGIISSSKIQERYENFQLILEDKEPITTKQGSTVDPKTLIPFYESFGMPFFQCFWTEWYPNGEMGNVYYSLEANTISDVTGQDPSESMAFPSFTDWLMFYIERVG